MFAHMEAGLAEIETGSDFATDGAQSFKPVVIGDDEFRRRDDSHGRVGLLSSHEIQSPVRFDCGVWYGFAQG